MSKLATWFRGCGCPWQSHVKLRCASIRKKGHFQGTQKDAVKNPCLCLVCNCVPSCQRIYATVGFVCCQASSACPDDDSDPGGYCWAQPACLLDCCETWLMHSGKAQLSWPLHPTHLYYMLTLTLILSVKNWTDSQNNSWPLESTSVLRMTFQKDCSCSVIVQASETVTI